MPKSSSPLIVPLHEMENGQEADTFALLAEKETWTTHNGKPYFRVNFRDAVREVRFPVWADTPAYEDCRTNWEVGRFYKLRAVYRITNYGPQLEIRKIRETVEADTAEGFDIRQCRPSSKFAPEAMYDEILALTKTHCGKGPLTLLVTRIFKENRQAILDSAAARNHHHAFFGGLLEHTLMVTRNAVALADLYLLHYPELKPRLSKPLVTAGAVLHDIGKIRELRFDVVTAHHTTEGDMIGHAVLGRDFVRDFSREVSLDPETQTQLEHILLSHQRFADWGTVKPPMSLEALIVHHADSCDALIGTHCHVMELDETAGEITSKKNILGYPVFKGKKPT
ncbi:MAG: HD domain-containing protein [Planctomycetaceae bacterium]|jgi:3'-5' exoribonuclease|nr:HD domain-containing protein [Planctomycetaceae bacterium]